MAKPKREPPAPWGTAENDKLTNLVLARLRPKEVAGRMPGRNHRAVSKQADELGLKFSYDPKLRAHMDKGGTLIREDCGGAVGVRWTTAERSGKSFEPAVCELFVEFGWLDDDGGRYSCTSKWNRL